jgi:carboxypeptidase T
MSYLNIDEVESALIVATSAPYTAFTQLITLPNLTWEGRQCHAIKIANGSNIGRPGVYFLGGVHAREWGSSDILIKFVELIDQTYQNNTGITLGSKNFSALDIQTIVNTLDIIVFPQANPDGRNYSMTGDDASWRKNRRTLSPNSNSGDCVGVDINRNYDFLWNFPTLFNPSAPVHTSTDPCDHEVYHGSAAFSEPESRNAKWIFDNFSNIGFFIDLHSFGPDILYSWGDDDDQTADSDMNFQNSTYNGMRGIIDSSGIVGASEYKEYIPSSDLSLAIELASTMRNGIKAVRGTSYTVKSSDDLYPTSGASDDYAYSRHFVDTNKGKIISYTVEWGTEFQPPYIEMQNIIDEITAGLVAFCLWICKNIPQHESIIIESSSRISSIVIQDQNEDLQNQPEGEFIINDTSNIIIK